MTSMLGLPLPPQEILLLGAAVLMAIALGLRLMRRSDGNNDNINDRTPMAPDLRWWRNSQAS